MPIITECLDCDRPMFVGITDVAAFAPAECEDCGETMAVEMTRMGGKTYRENEFVEDVLPDLEDIERVDHPDVDHYIYADRERVNFHRVEE